MQGLQRKLVYASSYEVIAIVITTTGLSLFSGGPVAHAGLAAVLSSLIALGWNLVFNHLFERWEARQAVRGRSVWRRMAHALGFEGGLTVLLVPLFAWLLEVSLWQALMYDIGLIAFFLAYTFVFNWVFDHLFGLPASAA